MKGRLILEIPDADEETRQHAYEALQDAGLQVLTSWIQTPSSKKSVEQFIADAAAPIVEASMRRFRASVAWPFMVMSALIGVLLYAHRTADAISILFGEAAACALIILRDYYGPHRRHQRE
ncbi:hypothetical protein NE236_42070 [Actinoallomurus purpureus]|uniref:hypothetical protein n=1 Tax=Actinoallomurus purpureus TaxID=478114 RepID=UPI002092BD45|nr:hypothetical protein [Actinoallomurus purpureus]MCO6011558.1 hypothetical protein [Actinoallomurus purpureus]